MNVYGHRETRRWFEKAFRASGKKLDMGKSCVRFTRADDLPLDVIGAAIARTSVNDYIAFYRKAKPPKTAHKTATKAARKAVKKAAKKR